MIIAAGSTDVTLYFELRNPATFVPMAGLVIANLDATYVRDRAAAVKADLSTPGGYIVTSAHTDNAAIEVDAANCPGLYRVDFPDAAFASGVDRVRLCVNGAAIDPAYLEVDLGAKLHTTQPGVTFTSATGAALTLSSTGANGAGLVVSGNGSGAGVDIDAGATGVGIDIDAAAGAGIDITASPVNWVGAIEINALNGKGLNIESLDYRAVSLGGKLDITGPETAIQLCSTDGPVVNVDANGAGTGLRISTGAGGTGIELITSSTGIDITTVAGDGIVVSAGGAGRDIVADITGNLSGSVGSVTGAVGSVTGLTNDTITDTVWAEAVPGAYAAGTAGHTLGNMIAGSAAAVWSYATRTLTSWMNIIGSIRRW